MHLSQVAKMVCLSDLARSPRVANSRQNYKPRLTVQSFSTFGNVLISDKQYGANLESCDKGLVFMKVMYDSQESRVVKRSIQKIKYEKKL